MSDKEELQPLIEDITAEVRKYVMESIETRKGRPTFTATSPDKAVEALVLLATGTSMKQTAKATGTTIQAVGRMKSDFADHLGEWKAIGGKVAGGLFFEAAEFNSELMQDLRDAKERQDWKAVEALSKAWTPGNKLFEVSHRQAMNARGEATQHVKHETVATFEDVDKAAADALALIQEVEIVEDGQED